MVSRVHAPRLHYDVSMRRLWLFLWCAGLFACRGVTAPTVPRHQEFTLTPRQMASIDGADIRVRFVGVQGDSRCPADALCIQRGDADAMICGGAEGVRLIPPSVVLMAGVVTIVPATLPVWTRWYVVEPAIN